MIISSSRSFIFIHIPKTAGEAITTALRPAMKRGDVVIENRLRVVINRVIDPSYRIVGAVDKHSSASSVRDTVGSDVWESSWKFAVVRDPVERMASLYTYLQRVRTNRESRRLRNLWYVTPEGRHRDSRNWAGTRALEATNSFSDFIRHPLMIDTVSTRTQASMLCDSDGNLLVDFVARFDRLSGDFSIIAERVGLPHSALPVHNSAGVARPEISSADSQWLKKRYADDYRLFDFGI